MSEFSAVSRRQKHLSVTIAAQPTSTGLHLLDSTGIKVLGDGRRKTSKHRVDYRRQWREVHLGIDADSLEIRAIEVTDNATSDAPILPCLLVQIPVGETASSVSGGGAYYRGISVRRQSPQRYPYSYALARQENLEEVERLSPVQPC